MAKVEVVNFQNKLLEETAFNSGVAITKGNAIVEKWIKYAS